MYFAPCNSARFSFCHAEQSQLVPSDMGVGDLRPRATLTSVYILDTPIHSSGLATRTPAAPEPVLDTSPKTLCRCTAAKGRFALCDLFPCISNTTASFKHKTWVPDIWTRDRWICTDNIRFKRDTPWRDECPDSTRSKSTSSCRRNTHIPNHHSSSQLQTQLEEWREKAIFRWGMGF